MQEIAPGLFRITLPMPQNPLGFINTYLIKDKSDLLLIDPGWNTTEAYGALTAGVEELGLTLSQVSMIICTHLHPDHFGLAGKIKQLSPKAELLAHGWDAATIEARYLKVTELESRMAAILQRYGVPESEVPTLSSASLPALPFVSVTFPDRLLYGGENISIGDYDLEVICTPGHSPGHICLFEPRHRILFAGDHILPSITPNIGYHVMSGDNPLGDYMGALDKLRSLPAAMVLPGHEEIFTVLKGRVDEIITHHQMRGGEILLAMSREARSANDLSRYVTWSIPEPDMDKWPPFQKRMAISETIAHLHFLRWQGKLEKVISNACILFRLP